ncbi:MAG: hypothetical protein WA875_03450 [Candidatus Acidiferrales bacterium]
MKAMAKQSLSALLTVFMLFGATPPKASAAPWQPQSIATLSRAVTDGVTGTFANLVNKQKAGLLEASDIAQAITALRIGFAYFQEAGANAQLAAQVPAAIEQLRNHTPTDAEVKSIQRSALAAGVSLTADDARKTLTIEDAQADSVAALFKSGGVTGLEVQILQGLQNWYNNLESTKQASVRAPDGRRLRLVMSVDQCTNLQQLAAASFVLAVAAALSGAEPVALGFEIVGDAYMAEYNTAGC